MSFQPVLSQSLTDSVVYQIRNMIIKQDLKPGDALPSERRLCELFGVSRTVVREANKRLVEMGLIEVVPGKGCFVIEQRQKPLSQAMDFMLKSGTTSLWNLLEIRRILEVEIAGLSAERASDDQIAQIETVLNEFKLTSGEERVAADQKFHISIANSTGNPLFAFVLDALIDLQREIRTITLFLPNAKEWADENHTKILEAIKRHDSKAAKIAMRDHLKEIENLLGQVEGIR